MKVMKMSSNHSELVFLALGTMRLVCGDNCLDMDSVVQRDKYMEHQMFRKFWSQSLYTCVSECLMSSACLSFGFEKKTRTCLLNRNSSDTANVVDRTGFLFSDIQHWPKSLSGRCAQTICQTDIGCEVTRLGHARCAPGEEFQGCGHPPEVTGANIKYDGHYQGAVATYSCDSDFRTCHNTVTSTCQSSGSWESLAGLCGRYRWHDPIQGTHPFPCGPSTKFQLILNGTPTKATKWSARIKKHADMLFHSHFRLDYNGLSNVVIINTRVDGVWGTEERFNITMAVGKSMEIQITFQDGVYMLALDGARIHNFTDRYPGAKPGGFSFWGDVYVSMVEWVSQPKDPRATGGFHNFEDMGQ